MPFTPEQRDVLIRIIGVLEGQVRTIARQEREIAASRNALIRKRSFTREEWEREIQELEAYVMVEEAVKPGAVTLNDIFEQLIRDIRNA